MKSATFLFLVLASYSASAQKYTVSGYVKDGSSGENLIGANIYNMLTRQGTATNAYGFYSLTLPSDSVILMYSFVGYQPRVFRFLLQRDTVITVELSSATYLKEVEVRADVAEKIHENSSMGVIQVPVEQIKKLPALFGEVDVLKILQLLPGVKSGTEGSSGMYVRGGGPDQNLILLDGVPVYNASHLFGFISVFNADAINHVELIKGGFPARFGGRLSSVVDISLKEGNAKELKGEGSISLISSKITLEGPIQKDRTSFMVSARRTYIDLLTRPLIKMTSEDNGTAGYFFYDLNAKINHRINKQNRIYLSAYMGDDKAYARYKDFYYQNNLRTDYQEQFGLRWGNITTALRWNHIINPKLFSNITATYSRYRFDIFDKYQETTTGPGVYKKEMYHEQYISGIRDYGLKIDFDYIPSPSHYIRFGGQAIEHLFTPGVFTYRSSEERDTTFGAVRRFSKEFFAYVEDDFLISSRLKVNFGLHASGFLVADKFYRSLQPRISGRYLITPDFSFKASYASMTQFIHLLTNAGLGLPTDLWVPATEKIGPEQSFIASSGFAYTLPAGFELSAEGYYKEMDGLVEYKDGASYLNVEQDWQTKIETGRGNSYGAELLLQKKTGRVSGWVGYTLSWTNRQFDNLNQGKWFPYKYDRRHDISVVLAYRWKDNREIGLTWVYGTGSAISLPVASYSRGSLDEGNRRFYHQSVDHYEGRNGFRMRPYHRLDLSYTKKKQTRWGERAWSIGIYNVYNRRNPFFMDIGYDRNGQKKFIQYSLFPLIPSIAYIFKF